MDASIVAVSFRNRDPGCLATLIRVAPATPGHEITGIDAVADPITLRVAAKDLLQSFIGQANRWDFF